MGKSEKSIREQVADEILQTGKEVVIGSRTYSVAPPTTATLVMVSKLMPSVPDEEPDENNVLGFVMANACHYGVIGEILAVLILGAKRCREEEGKCAKTPKWRQRRHVSEKEELAEYILEETSPSEQFALLTQLIGRLQVADFFGLTTFLRGMNILRRTKVG